MGDSFGKNPKQKQMEGNKKFPTFFEEVFALENGNRVVTDVKGKLYMEIGGIVFDSDSLPKELKNEAKQLQSELKRRRILMDAIFEYKKTGTDD
jgi:hypothetical protein